MISGALGCIAAGVLVVLCATVLVGKRGKVNVVALVLILALLIYGAFEIVFPLLGLT